MGRWKLGPQGGYYDANDSGPDQTTPTPEMMQAAGQGGQQPAAPDQMPQGADMGPGGITGKPRSPDDIKQQTPEDRGLPGVPGGVSDQLQTAIHQAGPFTLSPGEGGNWSMNGAPATHQNGIMSAVRGLFGGAASRAMVSPVFGGAIGQVVPNSVFGGIASPAISPIGGPDPRTTGGIGGTGEGQMGSGLQGSVSGAMGNAAKKSIPLGLFGAAKGLFR